MKTAKNVVLALICALALASCTEFFSSFASMVIHTVTFEENGGTAVPDLTTSLVPAMPIPLKSGSAFEGWFSDPGFAAETKVGFPYDPLADVTLYAKWIPATEEIGRAHV